MPIVKKVSREEMKTLIRVTRSANAPTQALKNLMNEGTHTMTDNGWDDDYRDGVLFRFWIRMASYPGGSPIRLTEALSNMRKGDPGNISAADYRKALTEFAQREGVNLP